MAIKKMDAPRKAFVSSFRAMKTTKRPKSAIPLVGLGYQGVVHRVNKRIGHAQGNKEVLLHIFRIGLTSYFFYDGGKKHIIRIAVVEMPVRLIGVYGFPADQRINDIVIACELFPWPRTSVHIVKIVG